MIPASDYLEDLLVSNDQAQNNQEIDLDDLEVEIMIVAKNAKPLSQASAFLTRRGWPTTAVSNLSQAIELAAEKKPDFVLVSLNHANPAMPRFIDLVQTTFNSTVVAFAENMDTASNQKLNKSNFKYKVFGQMSGPNLHRSLRRILAEKYNIGGDDHKEENKREGRDKDDDNVSVKGGANRGPNIVVQKNNEGGPQTPKGPIMIKSDKDGDGDEGGEGQEVLSAGKYKMGRANRRSLKDLTATEGKENNGPAYSPSGKESKDLAAKLKNSLFTGNDGGGAGAGGGDGDGPGWDSSAGDGSNLNDYFNNEDGKKPASNFTNPNGQTGGPNAGVIGPDGKPLQPNTAMLGPDGKPMAPGVNAQTPEGTTYHPAEQKGGHSKPGQKLSALEASLAKKTQPPTPVGESSGGGWGNKVAQQMAAEADAAAIAEARAQEARRQAAIRAGKLNTPSAHSMIEMAVQTGLAKICQAGDSRPQHVEKIENVGVFPIDSSVMPGYLVLAWPNAEPRAEEAFFQLAQESLRQAFHDNGVQARIEQGFFVQIPQVDFLQWTGQAAFNLSLAHRDKELAVAFFQVPKGLPKAKQVEGQQMFSINVDEISTDRPVTFKAYLHLQKNNKYFLYLRNGRQLQPEQQKRLNDHKVKDFYMKSVDIENLRSFLATSHLAETVKKSNRGGGSSAA